MDPNAGKKGLYNKLGPEELKKCYRRVKLSVMNYPRFWIC
jgi:hypothetical protein